MARHSLFNMATGRQVGGALQLVEFDVIEVRCVARAERLYKGRADRRHTGGKEGVQQRHWIAAVAGHALHRLVVCKFILAGNSVLTTLTFCK